MVKVGKNNEDGSKVQQLRVHTQRRKRMVGCWQHNFFTMV